MNFCIIFQFFYIFFTKFKPVSHPHTSPLKYKNSLSHLNTGRSYAFPSLYKMQKESFHMLYYFRFFFINNKSLNSSKAISFPALFKRTASQHFGITFFSSEGLLPLSQWTAADRQKFLLQIYYETLELSAYFARIPPDYIRHNL